MKSGAWIAWSTKIYWRMLRLSRKTNECLLLALKIGLGISWHSIRNQCEFNNRYVNRIILFCHFTSTDNLNTILCCIIINLISRRGNGDLKVFNIFNMTLCINVFIYCIHFISCVCLYVNVCILECVFMCMHNTILRFEFVLNLECLSSKRE